MSPTGPSWLPDACTRLESSQQHERSQVTSVLAAIHCRHLQAVDAHTLQAAVGTFCDVLAAIHYRHFQAVDARTLRAAVGTFCDLLALATRSIEMFGNTRKQ